MALLQFKLNLKLKEGTRLNPQLNKGKENQLYSVTKLLHTYHALSDSKKEKEKLKITQMTKKELMRIL